METDAQIKETAIDHAPSPTDFLNSIDEPQEDDATVEADEYPVASDPTIANAGLTEIDAVPTSVLTNGRDKSVSPSPGFPVNSGFGDGGNAAAEANWDIANDLSASSEWVDVRLPRDAAETDTGIDATPEAATNTQSWADEQPESPTATLGANPSHSDGFHEVQRFRGNRDSQNRGGRGGRGGEGYRGRGGFRGGRGGGEGGRGRGGPRGGANRGPRPQESS